MMPLFRGRFELKLDPKGRLSLPSSYRIGSIEDSKQIVITNSRYQNRSCLHGYSLDLWLSLERKMAKHATLDPQVQAFQRFYLSGGQVIDVDAQNRLLVPQSLRKFADLEGPVVLVGLGHKFEIWSLENWSAIFANLTENFEQTMTAVARLSEPENDE